MRFLLYLIVFFGFAYSIGHSLVLFKDKNKLGAFGMLLVGITIVVFSFFIQLK